MPAWCCCSLSRCLLLCFFTSASLVFSSGSDAFALGGVVTSAHAANVLYCIASNFQEVKHLASTLLQQLPPSAVGLQVNMTFQPFIAKRKITYEKHAVNILNNQMSRKTPYQFLYVNWHIVIICCYLLLFYWSDSGSIVSCQRGCVVSFRLLWTSVQAPNHLTVLQQPTFSTCCYTSQTWARLCCTVPRSMASISSLPPHRHSLLSHSSWNTTL